LVIDEAYVDFATGNALELAQCHENVLVLRTLSKGYGLAGLRLGFVVASPSLIAGLAKIKDSYNVDAISARIGAIAYRDSDYSREMASRVCASRQRLATALTELGFRVWPSEANFLLVRPVDGQARATYEGLKSHGILVRHFNAPGLHDKLRITVGTDAQNLRLVTVLAERLNRPHQP
jgi:histidinol-phosphate aminotransferase